MLKIRVLHTDGRDEVYEKVVKTTLSFNEVGTKILVIYTDNMTYHVDTSETSFIQHWVTEVAVDLFLGESAYKKVLPND